MTISGKVRVHLIIIENYCTFIAEIGPNYAHVGKERMTLKGDESFDAITSFAAHGVSSKAECSGIDGIL